MKAEKPEDQSVEGEMTSLDDSVEHLSMSSFTTASRHQFFEGAERGQILDVLPLLHLEDKNCVLIEADQGFGKTSLAHQVYAQTQDYDHDAFMVHGSELGSGDDAVLIQALGRHLKIEEHRLTDLDDGASLAAVYQEAQPERVVLVIDDAQQLSSMAVTLCVEFLSALPKSHIQLVFFSLPKAPVLLADSALQDYLSQYGHQVCLRALNSRETSEYVRFLLIASERDSVRFSRQALSRIFQMSAGVPSRVNEALVYALQDYDQQPREQEQERSEIVPKWHLISLSLVAAGVLALILFGNPEQSKEPRFSETIKSMPEAPKYQTPPILFTDVKAPQPLQPSEPAEVEEIAQEPVSLQRPLDAVPPERPEPQVAAPKPETISKPKVSMDLKLAKLKADREKQRALAAQAKAAEQASLAQASTAKPLSEKASWVKGMQPDHFTLQLLGGANKTAIQSFVQDNGSYRKMGYFETQHDGKPWYVVVYGDFPSREQAVAAGNDLPGQLRASKPWPRSAADIQSKMR